MRPLRLPSPLATLLLTLATLFASALPAAAYRYQYGGIWYQTNDDGTSVTVTYEKQNSNVNYYDLDAVVNIPAQVTLGNNTYTVSAIDSGAFYHCYNLTSITIPNTVSEIGTGAFSMCLNLNNVTMSNSVTTISDRTFASCERLTSINIPNSLTSIGKEAFYGCKKLSKLEIPNSVVFVGADAFENTLWFGNQSYGLIYVGSVAYRYKKGSHYSESAVEIREGTVSITDRAFSDCSIVRSVTIPNTVTTMGIAVFYGCNNLGSVTIGSSVKAITEAMFMNCTSLTSITIPSSVTTIGGSAFRDCSGLTSIEIPNSVTSIGGSAFRDCSGLTSVTIPNSVTSIGGSAFYNCSGLTNVTFPNSITSIGDYSFYNCSNLASLTIPASVNQIGSCAFINCSGLASISVDNNNQYYDSRDNCNAIVMTEDNMLVLGCNNTTIPQSITEIGKYAFYGTYSLTSVTIPNSVTKINEYAFAYCEQLSTAYILNEDSSITFPNAFTNSTSVYVPNTAVEQYKKYHNTGYYTNCVFLAYPDIYIEKTPTGFKLYSTNNLTTLNTVSINNGTNFDIIDNKCNVYGLSYNHYYDVCINHSKDGEANDVYMRLFAGGRDGLSFSDLTSSTQTTATLTFYVNRDEGFVLDKCGAVFNGTEYQGKIVETSDNYYKIECEPITGLKTNTSYSYSFFVVYKGEKFTSDTYTSKTKGIDISTADRSVGPTTARMEASVNAGDARVTDAYFTFNGEKSKKLRLTGLKPSTAYSATYTVETATGNQSQTMSFTTAALTMETQTARLLTNTSPMFIALTNIADEETSCGFEWRRYDAPAELPSTTVYCPVYGGTMAGTLKNMSENVYYKYRPFYKASDGTMYYGDWIAFITADAGVEFSPVVYTYGSPEVTMTSATLQGVALRGSSEITAQGFEYWRAGSHASRRAPSGEVTRVTAKGERMSATVDGLSPGTTYRFRSFVTAGGETTYGDEVEFVTDRPLHDVNSDGAVDVGDVNAVLGDILAGGGNALFDVNGDGAVDVGDVNAILETILKQ